MDRSNVVNLRPRRGEQLYDWQRQERVSMGWTLDEWRTIGHALLAAGEDEMVTQLNRMLRHPSARGNGAS